MGEVAVGIGSSHSPMLSTPYEAHSTLEALEKLELERIRVLRPLWDREASVPVPRPPLLHLRPSRSNLAT